MTQDTRCFVSDRGSDGDEKHKVRRLKPSLRALQKPNRQLVWNLELTKNGPSSENGCKSPWVSDPCDGSSRAALAEAHATLCRLLFFIPGTKPLPCRERADQQHAEQEPADVGEPGYAASGVVRRRQRSNSADELNREPVQQDKCSRNFRRGYEENDEDQSDDTGSGKFDQVCTHYAGDGA